MKKKILIIGGTAFVGRVLVEQLLASDAYEITLFNRGKTNPELFPNVRKIVGNREEADSIAQLADYSFDAVIDICGYYPLSLQKLVDTLRGRVERYIFVSTASVYDMEQLGEQTIDEQSQLYHCTDADKTDHTMNTYGKRKVACEQVLLDARPHLDPIILRPAVIYGTYDPFDRHYYWLYRIQQQAKMLVPQGSENLSAHTYVHDLARVLIAAIELPKQRNGYVYNATTHPLVSFGQMLDAMCAGLGKKPTRVFADLEFQEDAEIEPWNDLPLWINGNFFMMDNSRLLADFDHVTLTPLDESFRQTAQYYQSRDWYVPRTGLALDQEKEFIKAILYS